MDTTPVELHIFTDGGSRGNPGPAAIGISFQIGEEEILSFATYLGVFTNNEAEYTAFQVSLQKLKEMLSTRSIAKVAWKLDSMLVVEQLNKRWKIKEARMQTFASQIWQELATLSTPYTISYVPREQNKRADQLVNLALDEAAA
jgi:ribonuclease HI